VPLTLGAVMRAALIAGVLAGLTAAVFHFVLTEPLIDRAITLETLRHQAEGTYAEPVVSRGTQQAGLFVGYVLYGVTWSLLFGAAFHLVQRWLPGSTPLRRGLILALLGYWSVALLPGLKYPANPPGVGDPETIGYRQALYLGLLALSVAGTAVAVLAAYRARRGWWPSAAVLVVVAGLVFLVLPGNPDTIGMPADIVRPFQLLSDAGLTLFWAVMGLAFGLLLPRERRARLEVRAGVASP
jgi:predicted cobalt transporter CbtA